MLVVGVVTVAVVVVVVVGVVTVVVDPEVVVVVCGPLETLSCTVDPLGA